MQEKPDNRAKAITFTVLLHVILGATLILGIEFSDYRPLSGPKVDIVEAEVITAPSKPKTPRVDPEVERRKREQEAEKARQQEAEEQEKLLEAEAERKQAEAEKRRVAAEAKRKAEQETQRKADLAAKKKAEEIARKRSAEEAKQKAEEERRAKSEAEQKAKAEAERKARAESEQLARESELQEALNQEQRERELNPLRDAYSAAISRQITRNWLKPPGISDDLKCEALVIQIPDGTVTSARITRSSGNATFDESVIKAIYKAAPLPQAPSPAVFDRELNIGFCSTGNLC